LVGRRKRCLHAVVRDAKRIMKCRNLRNSAEEIPGGGGLKWLRPTLSCRAIEEE